MTKRMLAVLALVLLSAAGSYGQNGMVQLPPILVNSLGQPLAGINVAVCSSLTTSVAAVSNNIATLTVSSTTGFTVGMTLNVSGFTGADTFFNVSAPIISLSGTTLSYALTHANASASSNGSVYQTGNSSTPCAPLATLYTDHTTTTVTANPFTSTGLGNVLGWAPPAQYEIQSYGTGVTTTVQQVAIACVPNSGGTPGCTVVTNQANNFTVLQEFSAGISPNGTNTLTLPAKTDTLAVQTNPVLNGTPTGTAVQTTVVKKGTGSGNYATPADTNYHDVDSTNLSYTNTVPVGWILDARANGVCGTLVAQVFCTISLKDGSTIAATERSIFLDTGTTGPGGNFYTEAVIVGDGNSHTVLLQYKTSVGADAATILNSSASNAPMIVYELKPSN